MNLTYFCFFVLACNCIVACGGGGSDGSSSQIEQPDPIPPKPPSIEFSSPSEVMLSGATFIATMIATSAEILPKVDISCSNGATSVPDGRQVEITIPKTSVHTQMECVATVTDQFDRTANDSFVINILPKTEIGQVVGIFDPAVKLEPLNFDISTQTYSHAGWIMTSVESSQFGGQFEIKALEQSKFQDSSKQYLVDNTVDVEGSFSSIDFVQSPSLDAHGLGENSLTVISEAEDKVYWLLEDSHPDEFKIIETIDIDSPCFIEQTGTFYANDLVIGQVDMGMTVLDLETGSNITIAKSFETTVIQNVGTGRSLCHIVPGFIPESITSQFPDFDPSTYSLYSSPLTAIDFNTLELVFYGDINNDNLLNEISALKIETNSDEELDIVQVISRGTVTQVPRYIIALLSNGNHIGQHRIVQINFDWRSSEITQKILYEWTEGVPVAMFQGQVGGSQIGGNFRPDLVVVLGTVQQSLFFDNQLPLEEGFADPPVYGNPQFFNVGLGAGSAVAGENPNEHNLEEPELGVLVSYATTGEVIYITLPFDE